MVHEISVSPVFNMGLNVKGGKRFHMRMNGRMRVRHHYVMKVLACVLIFGVTGCVIPLPSKPDPIARFSKDELAFLDAPDATRAETVSNLGTPLLDILDPGVMVYTRAEIERSYFIAPTKVGYIETGLESSVAEARHAWVLLIAYDQRERILTYEVHKLNTGELKEMSLQWRLAKGQPSGR